MRSRELEEMIGAPRIGQRPASCGITSTVLVDCPSWSADGRRILFSLTRKIGDLFVVENPAP